MVYRLDVLMVLSTAVWRDVYVEEMMAEISVVLKDYSAVEHWVDEMVAWRVKLWPGLLV